MDDGETENKTVMKQAEEEVHLREVSHTSIKIVKVDTTHKESAVECKLYVNPFLTLEQPVTTAADDIYICCSPKWNLG